MEWSNESVFEFIELLQGEPDIWDRKRKGHRNRNNINDAWNRIRHNFSTPCSIDELKRKRNTLLTQYRDCLKKIKDSTKTGYSVEDIYKPSWFAFDALHNFMGDLEEYRLTVPTEAMERSVMERGGCSHESESSNFMDSNTLRSESLVSSNRSETPESQSDSYVIPKRQCGMQDALIARKQMDEALLKERSKNTKAVSECDLYGQLLAEKLKSLPEDHRLILMNEIDNLIFKYTMKIRQEMRSTIT